MENDNPLKKRCVTCHAEKIMEVFGKGPYGSLRVCCKACVSVARFEKERGLTIYPWSVHVFDEIAPAWVARTTTKSTVLCLGGGAFHVFGEESADALLDWMQAMKARELQGMLPARQTARIETHTGKEYHGSLCLKAHVFVVDLDNRGKDASIDERSALIVDVETMELPRGGHWRHATWDVPDGTLLKFFSMTLCHGVPDRICAAYFRADASRPVVEVAGFGCYECTGSIKGPLVHVPLREMQRAGVVVEKKFRRYYGKNNGLRISEVEEAMGGE